jgi:hypothetical protein
LAFNQVGMEPYATTVTKVVGEVSNGAFSCAASLAVLDGNGCVPR